MAKIMRKIVEIDEEKCDGCGLCVPECAEGAIKIVDGKAKLLADNLCDGFGVCLGHCPLDAIKVIEREADDYDESAVVEHLGKIAKETPEPQRPHPALPMAPQVSHASGPMAGGCPGSALRHLPAMDGAPAAPAADDSAAVSALRQWPVQLTLVPPAGRIWNNADLLLAADCVPFAMPDFHANMLAGHTLAIACPKLDDVRPYVEKLTAVFAENNIRSIKVAIMEVPCCMGLAQVVETALQRSGKEIPLQLITVGVQGQILEQNQLIDAPRQPSRSRTA